jgi:CHAD domain-containing protein
MPYRWNPEESSHGNVQRIAVEQIDESLEAARSHVGVQDRIHEARKACKRIRALLRLVRPALGETYQFENTFFRDSAKELAALRDASSVIDAYDRLMERFDEEVSRQHFSPVRRRLTLAQRELEDRHAPDLLKAFAEAMQAARDRVPEWKLDTDGTPPWQGAKKTYRRGRKQMPRSTDPGAVTFHEWRKRAKYHRHHVELLQPMFARPLKGRGRALHDLTDLLGEQHDLFLLRSRLDTSDTANDAERQIQMQELIDRQREELQHRAIIEGEKLFVDKPADMMKRWNRWWEAWMRQQAEPAD